VLRNLPCSFGNKGHAVHAHMHAEAPGQNTTPITLPSPTVLSQVALGPRREPKTAGTW